MVRKVSFEEAQSRVAGLGHTLISFTGVNKAAIFLCRCGATWSATRFSSVVVGEKHCPFCYTHKPRHPETAEAESKRRSPKLSLRADTSDGKHTCSKCSARKPLSEFRSRKGRPLGVSSVCKTCASSEGRAAYAANPELHRSRRKRYVECNREAVLSKLAEWADRNRGALRAYWREYGRNNRVSITIKSAKRRSVKNCSTPSWANPDKIRWFYERAKHIETVSGKKMHVDHIVPLVSPLVCGLHCEHNLRVIPAEKNLRKSNRYWPNMP